MKQLNITIHPFSALAGMALLGLVWVTAGAMPLQGSSSTRDVSAIEVVGNPHPRDFWRLDWGNTYTVPSGKFLVVTTGGHSVNVGNGAVTLVADGIRVAHFLYGFGPANEIHHLAFKAGTAMSLDDGYTGNGTPHVLGYLVDA